MSTPDADAYAADDRARRTGRRAVGAVGTVAVVAGLVLIGFGFGDWGPSKLGLTPPDHPTGRLVAAVACGILALLFTLLAGSRGRFGPLTTAVAVGLAALTAVVAWWLASALSPYAWPTHAGVAAATGAALIAWGVLAVTVGRWVVDRTRRTTRSGVSAAVVAAVLALAGCVPLLAFDVSPSVQVASSAGDYTPPAQLPTTPSWSTSDRVLGSSPHTVVLAHDADDRCIVQGVDPASGRGRWQWSAPIGGCDDAPADAVLTAAGFVAVPAVDREFVLDADTGRQLWSRRLATDDVDPTAIAVFRSTVAASSTTALVRSITRRGLLFTLVDLRDGRFVRTVDSQQVCPQVDDIGVAAGRVGVAGDTAAMLLTCADGSAHLVVAPATGDVTTVDAASPAAVAVAADTIVLADRPDDTTTRVRGLPLAGGAPRWTQTWTTTSPRTMSPGYIAALTSGAVVVATGRVGTTGVVRVDAATGALSAFVPPVADQSAIPVGCTDATCWYRSVTSLALVSLEGVALPLENAPDVLIGPAVIAAGDLEGQTGVFS